MRPLTEVSAVALGFADAPFVPGEVWRSTIVKLKVISSSLDKRRRKFGGAAAEVESGSYALRVSTRASTLPCLETFTCTYSITLSSPISLFAMYLVAGKAFGVMLRMVRFRGFVTVIAETKTADTCQHYTTEAEARHALHLFWSFSKRESPSPGLLLMFPIPNIGA